MKLDRQLLRLAQGARFALWLTIGLGFAGGVLAVFQARLLSRAIQGVFLDGRGLAELSGTLLWLLLVIGLRAVGAYGLENAAHSTAVQVKGGLRRQLFAQFQALGPARLGGLEVVEDGPGRGARTGELVNTAVEGVEALDAYFSQYLPQLFLAALIPITYLAFIFPIDALSAVILLITAPLIPVFMILIGEAAEALTKKQWVTLSRLSAYFLDVLQGLATLKILGRSRAQVEVIAAISERYRQTTLGVLRVTFLSALALELVSTLSTAVVAVEVGLRLLYGRLPFEQAFFILVLAPEFYLPLRTLGARFHAGMAGAAAGKRIFEILETPLPASAGSQRGLVHGPFRSGLRAGARMESRVPTIEVSGVRYTYPDGRVALDGATLGLRAGQRTALVGPSGAGKSTLASLLLRFIEPDEGEIRVNGLPLSQIPIDIWRSQVAWVPQNPYLFHTTVLENIRLALPEAGLEQVIAAACLAQAHEFIQALPQGYHTIIGERAARLSGGQAQRLALARAFLKGALLLILDEPSANLDSENEAGLQEAVQALQQGRTTLTIAHRLATVVGADRIFVLDEGAVQQAGTHAELLEQGGLYRSLLEVGRAGFDEPDEAAEVNQGEREGSLAAIYEAVPPFSSHRPGVNGAGSSASPAQIEPAMDLSSSRGEGTPERLERTFWRLLSLVRPYRGRILLAALLGFATVASSVGLISASAYIIASAALHPSIAALQVAIVGVRFFGLARGVFRYLERLVSHSVTFQVLACLRVWFYTALEPLAPARLQGYRGGDLFSRAIGDIASLENFYVRALAPPLVAGMALVGAFLFFSAYNLALASVLALFLLACGVGLPVLIRRLGGGPGRRVLSARAELNAVLVDGIQGMPDLAAFGGDKRQAGRVAEAGRKLAAAQRQLARLGGLQTAASGLLANLGMWAVLCFGIPLVSGGELSGVSLAVLVLAALTSFEAVLPLPQAAQYLENNLQAARRLFELVDAKPEVVEPEQPVEVPQDLDLELQSLSFGYREAGPGSLGLAAPAVGRRALEEVSFCLPPGKRLAVVGPSGAGKSTLVHLLLRFWEYGGPGKGGQILLNGRSLSAYRAEDLRRRLAVVSQNTYLFNATFKDNLLIARPGAAQAEIERAVKLAQLEALVARLPQGYDTWIGEGGLRLSAGERQRVAIARALLRDAPLLILDEATANLDTLTERQVLGAIRSLMAGRSTLMITHRLVGMEWMDEILVLRAGRVVERGRHQDLVAGAGWYAQIWRRQNEAHLAQKTNWPLR